MQSLFILALSALPSTLALALHPRDLPVIPAPNTLIQVDVAPNCARWDMMGSLDNPGPISCSDIIVLHPEITFPNLLLWNPSIGPLCDNAWKGYWICTAISGPFVPVPVQQPAGVPVDPSPAAPISGAESAPNCDRWDAIHPGTSCQTYFSRYPGLTKSDLQAWNPTISHGPEDCFLWDLYSICTSVVGHVFVTPPAIEAPDMTGPAIKATEM